MSEDRLVGDDIDIALQMARFYSTKVEMREIWEG